MARVTYALCALLLLCPAALTTHDDDFAFDYTEEELRSNHIDTSRNGPRRLWGVPDTSAYVGHLFRMEIPKEAFTGEYLTYKIRSSDGRRAPGWLAVDSRHGLVSGVPLAQDLGTHAFTVTARGRDNGPPATDSFTIEVKKAEEKPQSKYGSCAVNENRLVLSIVVDMPFDQISQRQRIRALMELAKFMALEWDEFWMEPNEGGQGRERTILMKGLTKHSQENATTAINLNVGCGSRLWARHRVLVAGAREQTRDGTLAHVLALPIRGWRLAARTQPARPKRQLPMDGEGSGYDYDDDDADYSGYDEDDEEYGRADFGSPSEVVDDPPPPPSHPHRHHHGDTPPDAPGTTPVDTTFQTQMEVTTERPTTTSTTTTTTTTTAAPHTTTSPPTAPTTPPTTEEVPTVVPAYEETTPEPVTSTNAIVTEDHTKIKIEPYSESASEANVLNISRAPVNTRIGHGPVIIVPETEPPPTTEAEAQTVIIRASNEVSPPVTSTSTSTAPPTAASAPPAQPDVITTPEPVPVAPPAPPAPPRLAPPPAAPPTETTVPEVTTQETVTSSERSSTIIGRTTETVTFAIPANQPPTLNHHMKKLATTAGKAFRYIIPANLFIDPEDGTNLTFTMYEADNVPLSKNSWIQFMPGEREVYGLPLETHVSKWHFTVEARDSEGAVARAPLDITVQEHKSKRTFNHEFIMQFKLVKHYQYAIDWQIRALEGIVNLFRDTDMDHLTVLNVSTSDDMYKFVWTNDTLPKETCPTEDINRLMKIMESTGSDGASGGLSRAMSPELKVASVRWRGAGACAAGVAGAGPSVHDTYPPVPRNQVDLLTATVGHLLVYRVPEDTFFDPEDGNTRNLKLSLRFSDRSEIPPDHWLQFDAKNQEFYGLPSASDEGHMQYQLVASDSGNKSAYDSLVVEVAKAATIRPTVEFHMTVEGAHPQLSRSALARRRLVERIALLFDRRDAADVRVHTIAYDPTTIVWYNTSLPMDRCPKREIEELRRMIIAEERGSAGGALKDKVDLVFDKDFKVMSIRLVPLGLCADQHAKTPRVPPPAAPAAGPDTKGQNTKSVSADGYTEYLVTFVIPAVVIVCMILVAGVIACVLYRRRRTGKMSVGDAEERQAFRSRGIPVIFQDELEERGDAGPAHHSPVIMRDEKPPLLPPAPDYRASDDGPYRPPPPFAADRTPPRHKATPTYRKPPPYVPP